MHALAKTGQVEYLGYTSAHTLFSEMLQLGNSVYVTSSSYCNILKGIYVYDSHTQQINMEKTERKTQNT
jgi:hypothetical protein